MIEVEHLTQRYGTFEAVRDLSFAVEASQVVGFLGPNGAGKSTTLRVIASYLAPSEGKVVVGGHDVLTHPYAVRSSLGYLPERCPLYEELTVRAHLEWIARLQGLDRSARRLAREREVARCGLADVAERRVGDLSKGYRQRVGIACALIHEPPILVLDEPTSGLDPNQVLEVRALVRALGEERTVLFSSHVLSEVEATCERAVVIHHGRVVADATLSALLAQVSLGAIEVRSPDASALLPLLRARANLEVVELDAERLEVRPTVAQTDLGAEVFRCAKDADLVLSEIAPRRVSLEDVFAHLTQQQGSA